MAKGKKKIEIHPEVGRSKAKELYIKYQAGLQILKKGKQQKRLSGIVQKGIVREFIGQYIPKGHYVSWGIVYDAAKKRHSSKIDAIVYDWPPVLDFADVVMAEKKRTEMVVMVKDKVNINDLFGRPVTDKKGKPKKDKYGMLLRDSKTELLPKYNENREFGKKYVLFIYSLDVSKNIPDSDIKARLSELSDIWVVVWKKDGTKKSFDYGRSVTIFMERLKALG